MTIRPEHDVNLDSCTLLDGGFKHFYTLFYFHLYFGKWSKSTNISSDGLTPPTSLDMLFFSLKNGFFIPAIRRIRSTEPGGGELGIRSVKWCEAWSCSKLEQRTLKRLPLHDCHIPYHIYNDHVHTYIYIYKDIRISICLHILWRYYAIELLFHRYLIAWGLTPAIILAVTKEFSTLFHKDLLPVHLFESAKIRLRAVAQLISRYECQDQMTRPWLHVDQAYFFLRRIFAWGSD